jgi:hypothetical protein
MKIDETTVESVFTNAIKSTNHVENNTFTPLTDLSSREVESKTPIFSSTENTTFSTSTNLSTTPVSASSEVSVTAQSSPTMSPLNYTKINEISNTTETSSKAATLKPQQPQKTEPSSTSTIPTHLTHGATVSEKPGTPNTGREM